MSDQFQISASEHGVVRIFAIDLPSDEAENLREADLARLLDAAALDVDHIDLFSADDLTGLGLTGYMAEGLGIPAAEFAGDAARLNALKGYMLIVRSAAFQGQAFTLTAHAPLRWIGTYGEARTPVHFDPLPTGGTGGNLSPSTKKRPSDAAMSGRVAMVVLLVLFALTGAMVWIAS